MSPKNIIEKDKILEKGFEILRRDGFKGITARKLAKALGISTMPIYVYFKSIENLKFKLLRMSHELLLKYQKKDWTEKPFLNTGIGYVIFAMEEKILFRECFIIRQYMSGIIEDITSSEIIKIMKKDKSLKKFSEEELEKILFRLWIFTFGFACLANQGFIKNLNIDTIVNILNENGIDVIESEKRRKIQKKFKL